LPRPIVGIAFAADYVSIAVSFVAQTVVLEKLRLITVKS
jgi:hypothetical protein